MGESRISLCNFTQLQQLVLLEGCRTGSKSSIKLCKDSSGFGCEAESIAQHLCVKAVFGFEDRCHCSLKLHRRCFAHLCVDVVKARIKVEHSRCTLDGLQSKVEKDEEIIIFEVVISRFTYMSTLLAWCE